MRAFVALPLPEEPARALDAEVAALRRLAATNAMRTNAVRATWTKAGAWHVTLCFFADLPAALFSAAAAACAEVATTASPLALTLWAGLDPAPRGPCSAYGVRATLAADRFAAWAALAAFACRQLVLYESVLGGAGAVHRAALTLPLGPGVA